ncbi:NifH/frxC-family protein [Methanotorris formicicus Mc-S-70]|uniref:NifH/frxC-family protein n=1 Tax=Methanotorris formicicus Mc-S-70 TaxID=647171 RepID=H1KWI1_9EURY|nr:NifH/frxC-family protein [Methanotorris formicicus Mc-S-70]
MFPDSEIANTFREIAKAIYENKNRVIPNPLSEEELDEITEKIDVLNIYRTFAIYYFFKKASLSL